METSSTRASSIASTLGAGSGVDMVALAEDLAKAQFESRQQRLESKSEVLDRQISLASTLRSLLSSFASALGDRVRTGDLSAQPTIANSAIAKVSAPIGTSGKVPTRWKSRSSPRGRRWPDPPILPPPTRSAQAS